MRNIIFRIRKKILQSLADLIIKSLENEKDEKAFGTLLTLGTYLDNYATNKGIYLD
jgi:hypothetical protein